MTTRRANGEGSVHHESDRGRWVGRLYVDGKRRKITARTRTDLLARMSAMRHTGATGETVGDGNVTFGDVAQQWRERVLAARTLTPSTRERYRWTVDLAVAELGRRRLRALTVEQVEHALDRCAAGAHGRPLARASLIRVRAVIVTILDFAVKRRHVANNVARLAELTASARPAQRRRSLTPDQAAKLWDALDGERLGPLFRLLLLSGLRPGEAMGLCWDVVDLDAGQVTVSRAVQMNRYRPVVVDELKTSSSYRTIGIGRHAVEVLRDQRAAQRVQRIAASSWGDDRLVFTSTVGTVLNPAFVRRELARICTAAGLPKLRPNELRHTAASLMVDAGQPLEQVADVLGHTSTQMLDATYRHRVRPSADAATVLDALVPKASGV